MARLFADSMDMYATVNDLVLGRWNTYSGSSGMSLISAAETPFNAGQAISFHSNCALAAPFETNTNETTVYFSIRFSAIGSSNPAATYGAYLGFTDGSAVQCSIQFCVDNTIRLFSGDPSGTPIGVVNAAFSLNTWDSYQGKLVFDSTNGSIELRKNGSLTSFFSISNVNTCGGTSNLYANGIALNTYGVFWLYASHAFDDVWFNSDNGDDPTIWPGDVRAVLLPVSDSVQTEFSQNTTPVISVNGTTNSFTSNSTANVVRTVLVTATSSGELASLVVNLNTAVTGHAKMALYDTTGVLGGPGTLITTSNEITNPVPGLNYFTVPGGTTITRDTTYWVALHSDATLNVLGYIVGSYYQLSRSYGSGFPATMAGFTAASDFGLNWIGMAITTTNAGLVADTLEDGDTSYVYSNTVGQEDIYDVTAMDVVPVNILGVAPYVFWRRSDAGLRAGTVSVIANGSSDTPIMIDVIPSLTYVYNQHFMNLDPTGATWTAATVSDMQIGVKLTV